MRHHFLLSVATGIVACALATPSMAGDTILYAEEGAWVDVADLPPPTESQG